MEDFMSKIRGQLRNYETILNDDVEEFDTKFNSIRDDLSKYFQRQIQYLMNVEKEYLQEFDYLYEENKKTSEMNRQLLHKLCLSINKCDDSQIKVTNLLEDFQKTFPMRPIMLKAIPEYYFKDIRIEDFIKKQRSEENEFKENLTLDRTNCESLSNTFNNKLLIENNEQDDSIHSFQNDYTEFCDSSTNQLSYGQENSFIPIKTTTIEDAPIPLFVSGSIGFSNHKQFASQNNDIDVQIQPRLASTYSTIGGSDTMINLLFKIAHQHDRNPCLLACHKKDNNILLYSSRYHQLEYLSIKPSKNVFIDLPFTEHLLNLDYSACNDLFYYSSRETTSVVLFRLNQQNIEVRQRIVLLKSYDYLISTHIYENLIVFLYLSSSIVMLGKYDIEKASFLPSISLENQIYDEQEQSSYEIIDFTINRAYITFLTRLKNKNTFMIIIHDFNTMCRIHSFDLIDAIKPLTIISIERQPKTMDVAASKNEIDLLLCVNDIKAHLIHCCNLQQYLISIQVNAFGICPLNDGNLGLVASKDIRGLKIQDYLQQNEFH